MNYKLLCGLFRRNREYRAFVDSLLETRRSKNHPFSLSGLTDGAEYVFLTTLAEDMGSTDSPLFLLFPDSKRAASFADFLRSVGTKAEFFPEREYCFSNVTSSHEFESARLSILSSLAGLQTEDKRPTVVCSTPTAMTQLTLPAETLDSLCIRVSYSEPLDTALLSEMLTAAGYVRVELVEAVGQFALRGGIVDVYPPSSDPVRIELFGDEIDRMGYFSIETQRFTENTPDLIVIPPVRELIITPDKRDELQSLIERHIRRLGQTAVPDEKHARALEVLEGELASIRNSLEVNFADKYLPLIYPSGTSALDYIGGTVVLVDSMNCKERTDASAALTEQSIADMAEHYELPPMKNGIYLRSFDEITDLDTPTVLIDALTRNIGIPAENVFVFNTRHVTAYAGNIQLFSEDLARFTKEKYLCAVITSGEQEKHALIELLTNNGYTAMSADGDVTLPAGSSLPVLVMTGEFCGGYETASPKFILMDLSKEGARPTRGHYYRVPKKKKAASEAIMSYADLEVGDFVVHEAYGIGQYMGLETLTIDGSSRDYVHIKYAGADKLFLPVDQLDHVSKYIGAGSDTGVVKLSKMGGAEWKHSTSKAKAATREMAKELIELYARRKRTPGISFSPDDELTREFADSFEYDETDGQLSAIDDIRRDMEQPYPMDRLLCGDVGYGKTEVALRAAFKAVNSGKQVAVLVPTTILAYQHFGTFRSRMRAFPIRIDMLSRFRTAKEQEVSVRRVARGDTDIIIGTHRLISKDISFKDLGLIIIDEEQRFGVAQKEKLKLLAVNADILTLTATPIPRTLSMATGGIVDMSVLEEAPGLRSPVQTYVMEHDDAMITEAIRRELRRGGQVFYLYNNVEGIYGVADRINHAIPDAKIAVAHGKMDRDDIEDVWNALIRGEIDILVCTTIIETGVDVPNANTLIIENADRYGLSQLHQIRGRVGRSSTRAFAYFTYRKGKQLTDIAEKRLSAIREYAEFGAGFRIALRDLEIRGAGNLLGAEQHGHLDAVGYDLYMRLLEEAVLEEKGEPAKIPLPDCAVDVRCDAYLTKSYIKSAPQRMDMYKRIARIENEADYDDIIDELCDRYGEPNSQAVNLCRIARIRALGKNARFTKIEEKDGVIRLYTNAINAQAVQRISLDYPTLGVKVMLGQSPFIMMRSSTKMRNTEFLIELLEKYNGYISG